MIHTYSLIHDDLPGMDDDDLRRGRPSNHKAFDVATAILAGDGLLTDAFLLMGRAPLPAERVLAAVREMALSAGSSGMVGGQEWDMVYTGGPQIGLEQLRQVHALKTGALLRGACVCGALLAGCVGCGAGSRGGLRRCLWRGLPDCGRHPGRNFGYGYLGQTRWAAMRPTAR